MADDATHPDIVSMPVGPALSATSDSVVVPEPEPAPAPEAPADGETKPAEEQSPATETPPAEGGDGEAGEEGAEETPPPVAAEPPRRAAATRWSDLAAARRLAEDRAAEATANVARLTALVEQLVKPAQAGPEPVAPAPRPVRETFADPDSYDSALIEWAAEQSAQRTAAELERRTAEQRATEEQARAEQAAQQQFETVQQTWTQAKDKLLANEEYADWAEVAENPALDIPETMIPALLNAENGPQVLYHLGKNPEEASRIAKLSPVQQAIEVGKLSAVLAQPPRPQRTAAPKPLETVGSNNNAAPRRRAEMPMDEYAAARLPEIRAGTQRVGMWGAATKPN